MSYSLFQTQVIHRPRKIWRIRWDDEMEAHGYKSRTAAEGWTGYPQTPAVFRYAPDWRAFRFDDEKKLWQCGEYRTNLTEIEAFTRALNANLVAKWEYWTDIETAQFNNKGWPLYQWITMSGNFVRETASNENFVQFETVTLDGCNSALIASKPEHLIHDFSLIAWRNGVTVRSNITPKGTIKYALIAATNRAWMPKQYLIEP